MMAVRFVCYDRFSKPDLVVFFFVSFYKGPMYVSTFWCCSIIAMLTVSRSINIFNDLAANATKKGVGIMLFSGNDDSLIPHRGTERKLINAP